jgi:hypothetical protein
MKQLLAPVVALDPPVLGVLSDAQISERLAVAQLWPDVAHQTCQFHYLREASRQNESDCMCLPTTPLACRPRSIWRASSLREYPGLAGYDALTQIETSLEQLEKKGRREADP